MKERIVVGVIAALLILLLFHRPHGIPSGKDSSGLFNEDTRSTNETIATRFSKPSRLIVGYPESWDSMDFFYNQRLDTNVVKWTNIYKAGDNSMVTNVHEYRSNKYWNTDEWEAFSRFKVDQQINHLYPEVAQIVEILQELPAVRRSNRLYSGAYSITFTMENIRNRIESYLGDEMSVHNLESSFRSQGRAMLPQVFDAEREWLQSERADMHRQINELLEFQRQALIGLYGEMPLPIFQRIMAIESGLTYKL